MYSTSIIVLALSALSSALPTVAPRPVCETPSSFTIFGFSTFTPSAGNKNPASVFFEFSDNQNSTSRTSCSRTGDINAVDLATCSDRTTVFNFVSNTLTVGETYIACANDSTMAGPTQTFGVVAIGVYCYPSEPPIPQGYGTECQTPANQLSGTFS